MISARIAIRSCISSKLTTNSPMCRWCSTVVGNSLRPTIVLENMHAVPATVASIQENPNARMTPTDATKKISELTTAVTTAEPTMFRSFDGCRSRPTRNSRKMMPNSEISDTIDASFTQPRPCGPAMPPTSDVSDEQRLTRIQGHGGKHRRAGEDQEERLDDPGVHGSQRTRGAIDYDSWPGVLHRADVTFDRARRVEMRAADR